MWIHQSGDETAVVLRQITLYVSLTQQFRIFIGRLQNLLNKKLRKSWMLGNFIRCK